MSQKNGPKRRLVLQPLDDAPAMSGFRAPVPPAGSLLKGGEYVVKGQIGEGGMGTVILAEQVSLHRKVAIKRLDALQAQLEPALAERFLREAEATAELGGCRSLISVIEYFEDEKGRYIVMPLLPGENLEKQLGEGRFPSLKDLAAILTDAAEAVDTMHAAGFVHRDIKPANIVAWPDVYRRMRAVLLDLGIVRIARETSESEPRPDQRRARTLTTTNSVIGTPLYMSPEQAMGKKVSKQSDIYSLGVVVYTALCNDFPTTMGDNHVESMQNRSIEQAKPITDFRPDLAGPIERALMKALAKDPADRYATAGDFARAFTLASESVQARGEQPTVGVYSPTVAVTTPSQGVKTVQPVVTASNQRQTQTPPMVRIVRRSAPILRRSWAMILGGAFMVMAAVGIWKITSGDTTTPAESTPTDPVVIADAAPLPVSPVVTAPMPTAPQPAAGPPSQAPCDAMMHRASRTAERLAACQRYCQAPGNNPFLVSAYRGHRLCR